MAIAASRFEMAVVFPDPAFATTARFTDHSSVNRSRAAWSEGSLLIGILLDGRAERQLKLALEDREGDRGAGQRPLEGMRVLVAVGRPRPVDPEGQVPP